MHILFWVELFKPHIGGIETFSEQLISQLRKKGHQFSIITCTSKIAPEKHVTIDGVQVFRFPFHTALVNRDLRQMHNLSRQITQLNEKLNPDLVHINSSQPSLFFYSLIQNSLHIPTLFTLHGLPPEGYTENSLVARTMLDADWVTAVSRSVLAQARFIVPEISSRSSVIYNGLRPPSLPPTDIPFNPPTLICLGRVVREKGFDLAIQALRQIQKVFPLTKLMIAGDGGARADLERKASSFGLAQSIEFIGWCPPDQVMSLIDKATMVIIPSKYDEPFGLVALEAGLRGRPVIASRTGGLVEVVKDNETGMFFDVDNVSQLVQHVIYLLEHPDIARSMGAEAVRRTQQMFNITATADAYEFIYQKLVDHSNTIDQGH